MALRNLNCLYTSQKLKKRKAYQDGILKLSINENRCDLYAVRDDQLSLNPMLASHFVTKLEMTRIIQGVITDIEFENYLVAIDSVKENVTHLASVKPKKFKVPSSVALVKEKDGEGIINNMYSKAVVHPIISNGQSYKNYAVTDDEIDTIWGLNPICDSASQSASQTTSCESLESHIRHQNTNNSSSIFNSEKKSGNNKYNVSPFTYSSKNESLSDGIKNHCISAGFTSNSRNAEDNNHSEVYSIENLDNEACSLWGQNEFETRKYQPFYRGAKCDNSIDSSACNFGCDSFASTASTMVLLAEDDLWGAAPSLVVNEEYDVDF